MFSQRNNPYCDLLENMVHIYAFVFIPQNNFTRNFAQTQDYIAKVQIFEQITT